MSIPNNETDQQDLELIQKTYNEHCTPFSSSPFPLRKESAQQLLDLGPTHFLIRSIKRTGKWAKRVSETPGRTAPSFTSLCKSITESVGFYAKDPRNANEFKKWLETQQLKNHSGSAIDIREEFQNKVGVHSLELWTLTEEEAQSLLNKHSYRKLSDAIEHLGRFVHRKRTDEMIFMPQEDVLERLTWELGKA